MRGPALRRVVAGIGVGAPLWLAVAARPAAPGPLLDALQLTRPAQRVEAPGFELPALDGRPVHLKDLRGRVVLLYFWATWCPYCTRELPSINQVHREWEPKGVSVILVDIREDQAKVARAVAERGYVARVVLDRDGEVSDAYGVNATPTVFLIAPDGTLVGRAVGPRPWTGSDGRALFQALLAPPAK
jgi:peroxiredoxin